MQGETVIAPRPVLQGRTTTRTQLALPFNRGKAGSTKFYWWVGRNPSLAKLQSRVTTCFLLNIQHMRITMMMTQLSLSKEGSKELCYAPNWAFANLVPSLCFSSISVQQRRGMCASHAHSLAR